MGSVDILDESIQASDWEEDDPPSDARINPMDAYSKWSVYGNINKP